MAIERMVLASAVVLIALLVAFALWQQQQHADALADVAERVDRLSALRAAPSLAPPAAPPRHPEARAAEPPPPPPGGFRPVLPEDDDLDDLDSELDSELLLQAIRGLATAPAPPPAGRAKKLEIEDVTDLEEEEASPEAPPDEPDQGKRRRQTRSQKGE